MSLTVGCLTYNEERFLPRLLKSVTNSSIVDEIVVVDTGSSDATVEIARGFNAKVWTEDPVSSFSKARNSLIRKVSTDWLLFLDADEQPGPGMLAGLADHVKSGSKDFDAGSFQRYNFFANGSFYLSTEVKLLQLSANPYYSGRVAESAVASLRLPVRELPLILNHFGHTRALKSREAKARRYLSLIDDELKNGSARINSLRRAAALIERSVGDVRGAQCRVKGLATDSTQDERTAFVLAHVERAEPGKWPGSDAFREAYARNPDNPSSLNLYAVSLMCENEFTEAINLLRTGMTKWPYLPHFELNLGLALQMAGMYSSSLGLLDHVAYTHPAFRYELPQGRLEFDPWRPLMSETIPGYAGLDYHREYLRSIVEGRRVSNEL